jgi:capsular polysaccharide export protein
LNKKINLLLLSNSKKRTRYFNAIKNHCSFDIKVYYYSNPFALKYFFSLQKKLDFSSEIKEKIAEIEFKYKKRNPLFRWLYKAYIKALTPILATNFFNALINHKANMVGLWNGKKYPENIMLKVAHFAKVQPIFFENGLLPDTTVVDARGVNATNSVPREASFFKEFPINLQKLPTQLQPRELAAKRVLNSANLNKEYIFVPFQTSFDSQILKHSPWIKDMRELFLLMSKIAKALQINIIFKEHPSEKLVNYKDLYNLAAKNPFVEFANANSTQELIKHAKAIVTINSSVGLESLLFEKKVIVLGEAFYAIKQLTLQASNKEELEELLKNIDGWNFDKRVRDGFLSYLINEYLVCGDWRKPTKKHFISLEKKIKRLKAADE